MSLSSDSSTFSRMVMRNESEDDIKGTGCHQSTVSMNREVVFGGDGVVVVRSERYERLDEYR